VCSVIQALLVVEADGSVDPEWSGEEQPGRERMSGEGREVERCCGRVATVSLSLQPHTKAETTDRAELTF
jgi:hypothetical protein